MATGTPKVPIVQQNGTPMMNLPTAPQLRPQFRRQGSSFGGTGYVSSMAVMPVPTKVDYSVTKGGLRLWAVLFVFIFLCSSLYALFSTKELAELTAIDIEDELNADIGQEMDEDVDDVGTQNRKVERDTTESKDNILTSKVLSDAKKEINEEENAPEDDEDNAEEEDLPEEEEMFAKLKAKAEERRKKQKHDKREHHHTVVDEMETKQPEDDEETAKEVKRRVKHKKKSVVEADDDEEVSLDAGKHYEELHGVIEEKLVKDESDKELQEANAEETDEGEEEEKKKPEGQQVSTKGEKIRLKKLQRFGSGSGTPRTIQECKRKNCPMVDEGKPRKELLKQKSRKSALRLYRSRPVELEDEEDEEEEDTTQDEVEVEDEENAVEDELDEISASDENQDLSVAKYERLYRKAYKRHAITNREDDRFRTLLDKADNLVEKHDYTSAFALFDHVLEQNEDSPRAHFGRARAYEIRSDEEADSSLLDLAINEYHAVLKNEESPDALYKQAASRLIERARFRGALHKVLMAQRALIDRYPNEPELQNDFALTFLMMGREDDAFKVYNDVLKLYPENGMAQAYYGFIQKLRGNFDEAVLFMRKGFRGTQRKITDPRFYYHFGDALMRLGKAQEAYEVYKEGAKIGLFLSPYQRSLHNLRGLSAKPWWSAEQTTYVKFLKVLEKQWTVIREEAIGLLKTHPEYFVAENPDLTLFGNWSSFYFYRGWSWDDNNCIKSRKTCELLKEFRETSNSSKSEMKLSLLTSNSRVWPHCGYSNCRLQAHLGLVVPSEARIRVADEIRGWKTGRFIIFDDSFEHELWFEGASANKYCLVLAMDLWHPDVASERRVDLGSL